MPLALVPQQSSASRDAFQAELEPVKQESICKLLVKVFTVPIARNFISHGRFLTQRT